MALTHVMVWKYDGAPLHLQRLHKASTNPEWIVLVPGALHSNDIDAAIYSSQGDRAISRYQTEDGDFVYIGDVAPQQIHAMVANKSDIS
jgi:hypothetical protein